MFIPDSGSRIPLFPSRIQGWQNPGSASKNLRIFKTKTDNKFSKIVSEWGNFLLIFSMPIRESKHIQNYDHYAYFNKGPPSFSGPDRKLLLPPLGGVWPRPGSGILVYLPPEQGHPRTPAPPPPHQSSRAHPLTFYLHCTLIFTWSSLLYISTFAPLPPPPNKCQPGPQKQGGSQGPSATYADDPCMD